MAKLPAVYKTDGSVTAGNASGRPVGAFGSRILVTLIFELMYADKHVRVAALCVGGMGVAGLTTR
ncbi:hypothetical protein ACJQWY_06550 [Weissella kandleri]|uniref:hypothetical protein n=1 Tax=Weissella kandleri TaxID=1616 RepID=UPI00387E71CD